MLTPLASVHGEQCANSIKSPVEEANPLVGTAPLDRPDLIGNAPPPGEPVYSGITSPGARLPNSSVKAAPVMGPKPNPNWGSAVADAPPSLSPAAS